MTSGDLVRTILLAAHDLGMGNGEYVFIGVELIQNKGANGDFSWYQPGGKRNKHAREMYEALLMVAVRVPTSAEYTAFLHKVATRSRDEFNEAVGESDVSINGIKPHVL
jgi:atrial natriuretic peptide receptor A